MREREKERDRQRERASESESEGARERAWRANWTTPSLSPWPLKKKRQVSNFPHTCTHASPSDRDNFFLINFQIYVYNLDTYIYIVSDKKRYERKIKKFISINFFSTRR
jgi:hypothetical protein